MASFFRQRPSLRDITDESYRNRFELRGTSRAEIPALQKPLQAVMSYRILWGIGVGRLTSMDDHGPGGDSKCPTAMK